jgi:hypothetical protein
MEVTIIACSLFVGGLTFGGLLVVASEIKSLRNQIESWIQRIQILKDK